MQAENKNDQGAESAAKQDAPSSSQLENNNINISDTPGEGPEITYSEITNTAGDLNKGFYLDDQGILRSKSNVSLYKGEINLKKCHLGTFDGRLKILKRTQALTLGITKDQAAFRITVLGDERIGENGFISRSFEHMTWPNGPRAVLLDIDQFSGTRVEMEEVLRKILPELEGVAVLIRPSSSSCIMDAAGNVVRPENKWHIYFVIDARQDMKALKAVLEYRCWANGYGWLEPDRPGRKLLSRAFFDLAVFSPERIVFEADPILPEGYVSFRNELSKYSDGGIMPMLPPLSTQEQEEVKRLRAEARKDPKLKAAMAYNRSVFEPILTKKYKEWGLADLVARMAVQAFYLSESILLGSTLVHLEDGTKILLGELLLDPYKYDKVRMLDPEDPTYQDNTRIAQFEPEMVAFDGDPGIHCFSHGGICYRVKFDKDFIIHKLTECQRDGTTAWIAEIVPHILKYIHWSDDVKRASEQHELRKSFRKIAGVPFSVFDATLKAVEKEAVKTTNDGQSSEASRSNIENHNDAAMLIIDDYAEEWGAGIGRVDPVGCDSKLYRADTVSGLWLGLDQDQLQCYIGDNFRGPNCGTKSSYSQIAAHSYNKVKNLRFFTDAPDGVPCANGFIRIYGDGKSELLDYTPDLRQTTKLSLEGNILNDEELRGMDGYDQISVLALHRFGDHVKIAFGKNKFTPQEVREQVNALQMAMGATLGGFLHKGQQAIFLKGSGQNGKSVILNVLISLIDSTFITASSPMSWNDPKGLYALVGKRLNIIPELPKSEQLPDGPFKSIIPGDTDIAYRKLYDNEQTFRPKAAHWFGCNDFVKTADKSFGFFRRCFFLDFPNTISSKEKVAEYERVIFDEEGGAILTWCIEGARKFVEAGYKLPTSSRSDILIDLWRNAADSVKCFLSEKFFKKEPGPDIYYNYRIFCLNSGFNPVTRPTFYNELDRQGCSKVLDKRRRAYVFSNVALIEKKYVYDDDIMSL